MKQEIIEILESCERDAEFVNGTRHTIFDKEKAATAFIQFLCDKELGLIRDVGIAMYSNKKVIVGDLLRERGFTEQQIDKAFAK